MVEAPEKPIIVFDVNETLLDITTLEPLFERCFRDAAVFREWFAQLILYSQTMTLSGLYVSFGELAVGALRMMASIHRVELTDADIGELKARMASMPAHADVEPALEQLRAAGFRLVTLTNSSPGSSPTTLERAGISDYFERTFSVDAVSRFKPAPQTYTLVAQRMGVAPASLCLVACHLWDTIGAQAAGCYGALVLRPHNAVLPASQVPEPHFVSPSLTDLAQQIIACWP